MTRMARCLLPILMWLMLGALAPATATELHIAAGRPTGVEAQLANAVCRLVNVERRTHALRCSTVPTTLDALLRHDADMALVPLHQTQRLEAQLRTVLHLNTPRGRWVLVARPDLPDDTAYHTTKAVIDRLSVFERLHPYLLGIDRKAATSPAPGGPLLHPGSRRYLYERGYG